MTAREIAEKTWELWNDYYKDGDLGSKEILDIIENDIKALTIPDVVYQSEQCSGCEESTGETKLLCCNHCGRRVEGF